MFDLCFRVVEYKDSLNIGMAKQYTNYGNLNYHIWANDKCFFCCNDEKN